MTDTSWLDKYLARGFRLVFYPRGSKHPYGMQGNEWTTKIYTREDYKPGDNIGVILGTELEPGKYLADIDFDWQDFVPYARYFFPETNFGFGRASKELSHTFYTTPHPLPTMQYMDADGKTMLVELRGTNSDESLGFQTMVPPSVHPSGEEITFKLDGPLGHADSLPRNTLLYAIATILYKHIGRGNFGHQARMATAGFLLGTGELTEVEVKTIEDAIFIASGNKDQQDVALVIKTTQRLIRAQRPYAGYGQLVEIMGGEIGKKVLRLISKWLGGEEFATDSKDRIIADSQSNIRRALEKLRIKLHFDEFQQKTMMHWPQQYTGAIAENEMRTLWLEVDRRFHFRPSRMFFDAVVLDVGYAKKIHPVREYLRDLQWDGQPRVDRWLIAYGGAADTPYVRAVSALVLIAAVRRVMRLSPYGVKFDELLVLESKQGTLKSSALRALCPNDQWFSDDLPLNVDAKLTIERTAGKWIIEAAELHGSKMSEAEHLKAFLSRQVDGPVRLAFDRAASEKPRQFIIIGTTNASTGYLKDFSGARRFWPVAVQQFNVAAILRDRDQIWAEAVYREASGESIRLDTSLYQAASSEQEHRRVVDPWDEYFEDAGLDLSKPVVVVEDLWSVLNIHSASHRNRADAARLSDIMQRRGYTVKKKLLIQRQTEINGNYITEPQRLTCWVRDPDITSDRLDPSDVSQLELPIHQN